MGAEGSQLNILGTVELDIAVDGIKAKQLFYICDNLKQSALLGMDFLRDNGCVVDCNRGTLHARDTKVKLKDEPSWEVHRVSLVDTVTIQPDQKVDLVCELKGANLEGIQGVLEPTDRFFQRFPIAVPSTLSLVNKGSVPVRFYNYSDRPVTTYKNTSVGEFCPAVERGQTIPTARNYRIEMYALVFGTEAFYPYLISKQFVARLDHRSLEWLQTFKQPKPQEARWVEYLQQFDMKIEHRAGRLHANADGLSRRPWPANQVADMPEEAENSPAPVIVEKTASSDATPSVEDAQSECKQPPPLWSNDHLKREQPKDKHLNAALQWLKAGKRPPKQEMAGVVRHMWSLWSQYDRLVSQDEVLYRRWFDEKTGRESLQLCVPRHLKGDLLQELHDLCGHLSVLKTTDNVRKRFYWFGHTADMELYCQTCHTCGTRNGPIPQPRAPMQSIKTGYPLERIQIDILGPLPETNRGNKYVAVVVDMYTK